MATYYRQQVAELHAALQEESEAKRLKAAEVLRSLIDRIVLTCCCPRKIGQVRFSEWHG